MNAFISEYQEKCKVAFFITLQVIYPSLSCDMSCYLGTPPYLSGVLRPETLQLFVSACEWGDYTLERTL